MRWHGKFKSATANSNSPRQIQRVETVDMGREDREVRGGSKARRGKARGGLGRHPSSINREIFTLNLLYVGTNAKIFRRGHR